ncbi:MAG: hypothetical protein WC536_02945 [Patescibacteria group bacterium]
MNLELSPKEMGLNEHDLEMTKIEHDKSSGWERFLKDKKYVIPAAILATLFSGIKAEAANQNEAINFLRMKESYKTSFCVETAQKFAPEHIETEEDGSKEIPADVLSEPIGNFIVNSENISLEKNWGEALQKNKDSFEKEIDVKLKNNPALANTIKDKFKSLYDKMFPKGLSSFSQIEIKEFNNNGNQEIKRLPVSHANTLEISDYMTEATDSLFNQLSKLPEKERVEFTKTIENEELEIVDFAVNQECQNLLKNQ